MALYQPYQGNLPGPFSAALEVEETDPQTTRFLKARAYLAANFRKIARHDSRIQGRGKSLWMQDLFHAINELDKLTA